MTKNLLTAATVFTCCLLIAAQVAFAQRGGRNSLSNLRDGREVRGAFREVVATANKSTVRVTCNGRDCALGTVVDSDGWIVTKYSELRDKIVCRTHDNKQYPATVVGYDSKFDLALLKVEATGLKPVDWADYADGPAVGQLVASTSSTSEIPQAVGVISVPKREIPHRPGVLGVQLDESTGGAKIAEVSADSGAEQAGLKPGDLVIRIDDMTVRSRENMINTIRKYKPLDIVELKIKRGDQELNLTATLKTPSDFGQVNRSDRMNMMGGQLSKRAADFPSIIQHDTVLRPSDCGGPVVDLTGKVVGINIARAGRTESYAVPADRIQSLLPDLQSGKFAPKYPLPGAVVKKTEEVKANEKTADDKKSDPKSRDTNAG